MSATELAERLDAMALVASLPATCPQPCCEKHPAIRLHIWPDTCREELRLAAKMLRKENRG